MARPFLSLGLGIGVGAALLYQYVPPRPLPMPADERAFERVIETARLSWVTAPNDLARTSQRAARAAALCAALPAMAARNWTGRLITAEPNHLPDLTGHATAQLTIRLAANLTLSTPSNPLTNLPSAFIEAGSPLYAAATAIPLDAPVSFSASFPGSGDDCLSVTNFGEDSAMRAPDFKIILTALTPLN
jgi:hypothetical protein